MELDVNLKKSFGTFTLDVEFGLSSPRTGIFGRSGSGKSTIMNLLAGLSAPDTGHIRLGDTLLFDSKKRINLKPDQRDIGVVFQHAHLFPHMSVKRNILYGYKRNPKENRRINPEDLYDILGITPLLSRNVTTLSGGERQRIALARTVLSCPRLILMDEPLSALDEAHKFQIIPYLNKVFDAYQIPLLFISHSVLEMRMMTDEILVVDDGRVKQHSATDALGKTAWDRDFKCYINLFNLKKHESYHSLYRYQWGNTPLLLTEPGVNEENLFELDSRQILLFKRHPEATSARNLLDCTVTDMDVTENRVRVELACGKERIVAQVVPEAVPELDLKKGAQVVAVIKASAFKKIL